MKSRTRKIGKIASLAASEESRFGQIAGRSRQHLQEQLDRLGELNAFRQNYVNKSDARPTVSSAHWQDYQDFLRRLDTAVNAQQQIVRDCERNLEIHRQRWMAKRQRLQSLERVLEKYETEDQIHEARREQKRLDELPKSRATGFAADDD
ncbi:MAG: flagellar export protein FliJ [Gammaproteobacteria bacterium]|nr:flagellar export protein FliJ [Gammaproteobacteria bacterium]